MVSVAIMTLQMSLLVGLFLLTLGLVARRSEAQAEIETCDDLISGIEGGDDSFELMADIICTETIVIKADTNISIDGGYKTLTISESFTGLNASVFYNQGTLEVTQLTITPNSSNSAVRGVFNKGELMLRSCTFERLNVASDLLDEGGAIYSNAEGVSVVIESCVFDSNAAGVKGGAICAVGTEFVELYKSEFQSNEAGIYSDGNGSGGDIYAADGVTLSVQYSNFAYSFASYGGGAIECCGGTITGSIFTGAESSGSNETYGGALLVGRPDYGGCENQLFVDNSTFSGCVVESSSGAGGSIAIFDTSTTIHDCLFEGSQGTAVLFQSSSASGDHEIRVESSKFYDNSQPAAQYSNGGNSQGTAIILENTATLEGETVGMGTFENIFCYANDPYECEVLYEGMDVIFNGDFKCQMCNFDSERLYLGIEDDSGSDFEDDFEDDIDSDGESASSSSGSSVFDDLLIIALAASLAAALLLLICIVCAMKWLYVDQRTATRGAPHRATAETGTQPPAPAASAPPHPDAVPEPTATA